MIELERYFPRVRVEAARRTGAAAEYDDLYAVGLEALLDAASRFEPERGLAFWSFAQHRVRGAMAVHLEFVGRLGRMSRGARRRRARVGRLAADLRQRLGRRPGLDEVADACGMTERALSGLLTSTSPVETLVEDEHGLASPLPSPEAAAAAAEESRLVLEAVRALRPSYALIVEQFYLKERSLAEIGAATGLSTARVSQIANDALSLLRPRLRALGREAA